MLNDKPCDECDHFDPILRGTQKGLKTTRWGWCAKLSIYPHVEAPGQKFPSGVKRAEKATDRAQPKIVSKGEVVTNCRFYALKKVKKSKAELLAQVRQT